MLFLKVGRSISLKGKCVPFFSRSHSSIARLKRCDLFEKEKARQRNLISRIEKIEVSVVAPPDNCTLVMNKGLSTPFNCAMHINELHMQRSVLALLNGKTPWDMHRPLEDNCSLEFVHFKSSDPHHVNVAFWRTGSFLLGYVLEQAFREEFNIQLCSFPPPDISSGSFVYDVELDPKLISWTPSSEELVSMSRIAARLSYDDLKFERLVVSEDVALEMFSDNKFKSSHISSISAKKDGNITLYRMGDHVDITGGPLISSTRQLSHWFQVVAFHDLGMNNVYKKNLHRVQGLAIPVQFSMHKWTFDFLANRARLINQAGVVVNS